MSTPAGWYDDGSGRLRWWDGAQWTDNFAPDTTADQTAPSEDSTDQPVAAADDQVAPDAGAPAADQVDPQIALDAAETAAPVLGDANAGQAPQAAYAGYPGGAAQYPAGQYPGGQYPGGPYPGAPAPEGPKKVSVIGWIAFIAAIVGFILACIPTIVTTTIGLVVLGIALILSIIALVVKGKKWPGITGLILSIVGGVIGVIMIGVAIFIAAAPQIADEIEKAEASASAAPTESSTPADESSDAASGRPTSEEMAVGIRQILDDADISDQYSDDAVACIADDFVASDLDDETLQTLASGTDIYGSGAQEVGEVMTKAATKCLSAEG